MILNSNNYIVKKPTQHPKIHLFKSRKYKYFMRLSRPFQNTYFLHRYLSLSCNKGSKIKLGKHLLIFLLNYWTLTTTQNSTIFSNRDIFHILSSFNVLSIFYRSKIFLRDGHFFLYSWLQYEINTPLFLLPLLMKYSLDVQFLLFSSIFLQNNKEPIIRWIRTFFVVVLWSYAVLCLVLTSI